MNIDLDSENIIQDENEDDHKADMDQVKAKGHNQEKCCHQNPEELTKINI